MPQKVVQTTHAYFSHTLHVYHRLADGPTAHFPYSRSTVKKQTSYGTLLTSKEEVKKRKGGEIRLGSESFPQEINACLSPSFHSTKQVTSKK